jgi:hypothetical protein
LRDALLRGEGASFCQKVPKFRSYPSVEDNIKLKTLEWLEIVAERRDAEFCYSELMSNFIFHENNFVALKVKGLIFHEFNSSGLHEKHEIAT